MGCANTDSVAVKHIEAKNVDPALQNHSINHEYFNLGEQVVSQPRFKTERVVKDRRRRGHNHERYEALATLQIKEMAKNPKEVSPSPRNGANVLSSPAGRAQEYRRNPKSKKALHEQKFDSTSIDEVFI